MAWLRRHARRWLAWAMVACASVHAEPGRIENLDAFLDKAEAIRASDHARFVQMLAQVHADGGSLTPPQHWRLRWLDAWQAQFGGDYVNAEVGLRDIIKHSGHMGLVAKARGLLLSNLAINRRYDEAFSLANVAVDSLPEVQDPDARTTLLSNLAQTLNLGGHPEIAIQYARMMVDEAPAGTSLCRPLNTEMAIRYVAKELHSNSPELDRAIQACTAANMPVLINALMLNRTTLLIEEKKPAEALRLLDSLGASVERVAYYPALISWRFQRAQALAALGRDNEARQLALQARAMFQKGDVDLLLSGVYQVLYEVEKRAGNTTAALAYYQEYVNQDRGYLSDVSARTMAYEAVQQRTLLQKLETDKLARQNSVLQLEKALSVKAVETSRLYIVLLVVIIASIAFWLYRIKRSQLRFKQLSHHDGLTGIFNHQHFMTEAERVLHLLEKRGQHACLILLDLDHFKVVNDTHGHAVGDAVLRRAVATCRQQLRQGDMFGRLGGEEFGVLIANCSPEHGLVVANCVRAAIEASPVEVDGHTVHYSTSVGMASTRISGHGVQRLRRDADAALYRAKRGGRNRVVADLQGDGLVGA
ncbi:GGDEF domain-containing protein [Bacillus sp. NP157]|nr:GGDEF domain-containing protein [Bacillus sp. NP157]